MPFTTYSLAWCFVYCALMPQPLADLDGWIWHGIAEVSAYWTNSSTAWAFFICLDIYQVVFCCNLTSWFHFANCVCLIYLKKVCKCKSLSEIVKCLTCIWKVPDLGGGTGYPDLCFSWFSSVPPGKFWHVIPWNMPWLLPSQSIPSHTHNHPFMSFEM